MSDGVYISFPGLGIDEFKLNSVAFAPFGIEIRWYAIIICTGIVLAFLYFFNRAKRTEELLEDDVLNVTLLAVPLAIVGARFLYVITNLESYDSFLEMINMREGGIAIYGGIIFGALAIFGYTYFKKLPSLKFYDAICPAVMIGQIIGRWGNFMNGEAFGLGYGIEKLPWRMTVQRFVYLDNGVIDTTRYNRYVAHPTFLYESLWNLLGFVLVNLIYKKKKFDGQIFLFYVAWYGFGRGLIEILRSDSLLVFGQKLMVYLGLITCAVAITFYVIMLKKSKGKIDEVAEFIKAKNLDNEANLETVSETEDSAEEETENDDT